MRLSSDEIPAKQSDENGDGLSYEEKLQQWQQRYASAKSALIQDYMALAAVIGEKGSSLAALAAQAAEISAQFGQPSDGGSTGEIDIPMDTSNMSDEELIKNAYSLPYYLEGINGGFKQIAAGLGSIGEMLSAGQQEIEKAKAELAAGEKALKQGEHEAQKALEDIWYNLGELEKDRTELEENKIVLDEEAVTLSKEIKEAEELRELENDHVSAKLLLTSVKEVNDMFEQSGELVPSAEKYLESYKAETESLNRGRLIVCILALIGGLMGLAGIPAVYELVRKRAWLIWPVVLCLLCAAAAETLYYFTVHEMWYVGLFVAVIAALHLLIVLPQEKKPIVVTET